MNNSEDNTPLVTRQINVKVYKRRWYILLIFSLVAVLQDTIWNTWGPIDHTAVVMYGWSDKLVALLANYGSILYIVAFIPMVWILGYSVRVAMIVTSGFMAFGSLLRCATLYIDDPTHKLFTISCHVCSILNGMSNIVVGSAPLAISSSWFSPEERVTATTVAQVFNGLGTGMSFLLASQIVRPIDNLIVNGTISEDERVLIQSDIEVYMFSNAVPAIVLFLLIVIYFPSNPKIPPSLSSQQGRLDFISGFSEVMKSGACWLVAVGCSIPQGISVAWTAMMVINLTKVCEEDGCLTQHWVNYLGIYTTVASTAAAIGVARLADKVKGKLKEAIIFLLSLASVTFVFLSLISVGFFKFGSILYVQILVYILLIFGTSLVVSSMPLAMELAMELCYPAAEGVVGGFISIWFNISTVAFLSLFNIPNIGTSWLDYVLPLSCLIAIPLMVPVKVNYRRMELDSAYNHLQTTGDKYGSTASDSEI